MELLCDLNSLAAHTGGGTAMAIGVFDGVHRGHQMLLARAVAAARARGVRSLVLTFTDHPLRLLAPPFAPPALSGPEEKARLIGHYGADLCAMIEFTPEFAATPAPEFLERVVAGLCRAKFIVCGDDFHFGARGQGNAALLRAEAARLGYEVDVPPALMDGAQAIRSSRIRLLLSAGALDEAIRLLGHNYTLRGRVIEGDRRGRTIGYPTANLDPPPGRLVPLGGVYAVRARWAAGAAQGGDSAELDERALAGDAPHIRGGMLNIGTRPTFGGRRRSIEAHLFDFNGDLYGRELEIEFIARVREERKFETAAALIAQLRADEKACRGILSRH